MIQHLTGMLKNSGPLGLHPQKPLVDDAPVVDIKNIKLATPPSYKLGEQVATRVAYGTALAKLAKSNPRVVALDGDTKNSTYAEKIKVVDPARFIEGFIAEQNVVGVVNWCSMQRPNCCVCIGICHLLYSCL